jgi:hypothetical protein
MHGLAPVQGAPSIAGNNLPLQIRTAHRTQESTIHKETQQLFPSC